MMSLSLLLFCVSPTPAGDAKKNYFETKVRPILARCVRCHGGDEPSGSLDLTTRAAALKGGETGPALRPGKSRDSLLYGRAAAKEMPPKKPLGAEELAVLRRWVDDGATWDGTIDRKKPAVIAKRAGNDWWSLQPIRRPTPPHVKRTAGEVHNPIDLFVLAKLQGEGLNFAPPAERVTLLRRVTFDLLGLPPTPEEVDAFVNDQSPDAYERVVDRLLASPHHGERWGRHWLDVARFGESQGFERDKLRDHAWRYRDYVIRSFNQDMPFSRFVREQLAGDVLDGATSDSIAATGFLVCGPWDEVGATQQGATMRKRSREEELEDMVSAVSQTFLGLTVNCARCHNHKFDPIPQRDYYRLKAALEGVYHGDRPLTTPEELKNRQHLARALEAEITATEKEVAALEQEARAKVMAKNPRAGAKDLPVPLARWSFEGDARDSVGALHGSLQDGAVIRNGRLKLDGKKAFVRTAPLRGELKAKTLEAWVALDNLAQKGGGVLTVQTDAGKVFDSIVFGERAAGQWMAGSEGYVRTRVLNAAEEKARPGELVHVAITYSDDGRITVYHNGQPYGASYRPASHLETYAGRSSVVLFGRRHTGGGNAFLAGEIEEARLYGRALSAEEVTASFRAGVERVPLDALLAALTPEQRARRQKRIEQLSERRGRLAGLKPAAAPLAYAASPRKPEPTFVLTRGDVEKPAERVSAGGLSAVRAPAFEWGLSVDAPEGERRRKLADWVAHPDNPLTPRVMANRVWQYHFGQGLVHTPSDFGFNGGLPSHPELLDWLASELTSSGGSLKHLHRLIVLSGTYRQSSRFTAKAAAKDADNHWLWRYAPHRLEGEAVRDAMLAVSGKLNPTLGGPSFRPFTVQVFNSTFYTLVDRDSPDFNRRTVYRMNVGSAKNPLLESFDCPDPSVKTPRRGVTTTPLQALELMNSSFVVRQSRELANRVKREAGASADVRIARAYRIALGRAPSSAEALAAAKLAKEHGLESVCWVLLNASEFLYVK
jgi:hypothetical protein